MQFPEKIINLEGNSRKVQPIHIRSIKFLKEQEMDQDWTEDPDFCVWDDDGVQQAFRDNNLIFRKFLSEKPTHKPYLSAGLLGIRCDPMGLQRVEVENGLYRFSIMSKES